MPSRSLDDRADALTIGHPGDLCWLTVPVDDPGDLLERLAEPGALAWVRGGEGVVGWGEYARIPLRGTDPFDEADEVLRRLVRDAMVRDAVGIPGTGPIAFGSFAFDRQRTGSVVVVPRVVVGRRDGAAWVTTLTRGDEDPGHALSTVLGQLSRSQPARPVGPVRFAPSEMTAGQWLRAVEFALAEIGRGVVDKVVLSRDLVGVAPTQVDPRGLLRRLGVVFPQCYVYACAGLVGATPELLVRREGDWVESLVLAGSAVRGPDADADARLGDGLLASAKEGAEHRFAVESVVARLSAACRRLDVPDRPSLLTLANIQHLATRIVGRLERDVPAVRLAALLHPTAAVCGVPDPAALRLIRNLERRDRGRYTGPVGWLDPQGGGEWGIALRCAQIDGRRLRVSAGAGVVDGSVPTAELAETEVKLGAVLNALAVAG